MEERNWKKFENECVNWLKSKFGDLARFDLKGGNDSGVSDIKVTCPNGVTFYIEVKSPVSQCSQFVLLPDIDNQCFIYSDNNKLEMNPFTQHILDYMNDNYSSFCNPGSKGKEIDPNLSESAGHIRYQHMVKGVELFISKGNNGYILIPLSFIGFYFDIEAVYRNKRSGSSNIPKRDEANLNFWLKENYSLECHRDNEDEFVCDLKKELINKELKIGDNRYMFRITNRELVMRMRKLSNTNNANVIFTIKLKQDVEGLPDYFFRSFLTLLSR